jgi:hypothetical protein
MLMQMFFNGQQANHQVAPTKSDDDGIAPSPWANIISVGLRLVTAFLTGNGNGGDGIDKVDNGNSPMQVGRSLQAIHSVAANTHCFVEIEIEPKMPIKS